MGLCSRSITAEVESALRPVRPAGRSSRLPLPVLQGPDPGVRGPSVRVPGANGTSARWGQPASGPTWRPSRWWRTKKARTAWSGPSVADAMVAGAGLERADSGLSASPAHVSRVPEHLPRRTASRCCVLMIAPRREPSRHLPVTHVATPPSLPDTSGHWPAWATRQPVQSMFEFIPVTLCRRQPSSAATTKTTCGQQAGRCAFRSSGSAAG